MQETNISKIEQRYEQALHEICAINEQLLIAGLREQELAAAAQALEERARQAQQAVIVREQEKAVLAERGRIAEDFHDTLAQYFTGIKLQLDLAEEVFTSQPQVAYAHLQRARALAEQSIGEAHRCIRGLHPQALAHSDLPAALAQLVEQSGGKGRLGAGVRSEQGGAASVRLVVKGTPCALSPVLTAALFHIGQEALTNAVRHGCASHITVTLTYTSSHVRLRIRDDGQGFDVQQANEGFGLTGLRERAARAGGKLTIRSKSGRGTEISVAVNLPKEL